MHTAATTPTRFTDERQRDHKCVWFYRYRHTVTARDSSRQWVRFWGFVAVVQAVAVVGLITALVLR
jgi:hypothetical protein